MIKINYPDSKPAIQQDKGREKIFCIIRKTWLVLTPEEWVRQNFLLYLTELSSSINSSRKTGNGWQP